METSASGPDGLRLHDLSAATGLEPRTIRSYVEKGVIPGPETLGRGARYPVEALDRLKVVQLLRDADRDLTLDQIRLILDRIGRSRLRAIAVGDLRLATVLARVTGPSSSRRAALDYLQGIAAGGRPLQAAEPPDAASAADAGGSELSDDAELPVLENAARALASLVGLSSSSRGMRGESWYRISLTPDIELSVRGDFGTEQLAQLHRIGDALRTLFTKGPSR